jgi:hypothetical protein
MQLTVHPCNDAAKPAVRRLIIELSRPNYRGLDDRRRKRQHPDRQRAITHQLFRDALWQDRYHVRRYKDAHCRQERCAQRYSTCEPALREGFIDEIGCVASLTFVTGTLSRLGMHLALAVKRAPLPESQGLWDTHMHRARLLAGIWSGFVVGALLSGVATPHFGVWVLLFPVAFQAALATFDGAAGAAA